MQVGGEFLSGILLTGQAAEGSAAIVHADLLTLSRETCFGTVRNDKQNHNVAFNPAGDPKSNTFFDKGTRNNIGMHSEFC